MLRFSFLSLLLVGCAEAQFTGASISGSGSEKGKSENQRPEYVNSGNEVTKSSEFAISEFNKPVDLIWFFDTSGSMVDEIEVANRNLAKFLRYVEARSNINIWIVGEDQGLFSRVKIEIPSDIKQTRIKKISEFYSTDNLGLGFMAGMLCSASASSQIDATNSYLWNVCGKSIDFSSTKQTSSLFVAPPLNKRALGALNSVLRPNANVELVVVGDADSVVVKAKPFLDLTSSFLKDKNLRVNAIVGRERSCGSFVEGFAPGKEYISLAKSTGGKAMDICEKDWRPFFDELAVSIVTYSRSIKIKNASKIVSVKVGETILNYEKYSFNDSTIRISADVDLSNAKTIVIAYTSTES